jgi:dTDP-4-dehydrorhamnose 3,5-epimerase
MMQAMIIEDLALPGLKLIRAPFFQDSRGAFCQVYQADDWQQAGIDCAFVQDNFSVSAESGTLRGLHFQRPPAAQAKLIQVIAGAILDVAVDIRRGSPTYGHHLAMQVEAGPVQLFIPEGFAHGFMTLVPETIVYYKVSSPYDPANEGGIHWADPDLAIVWPLEPRPGRISGKDERLPRFRDLLPSFAWETLAHAN